LKGQSCTILDSRDGKLPNNLYRTLQNPKATGNTEQVHKVAQRTRKWEKETIIYQAK